jgi:hypothetical protein
VQTSRHMGHLRPFSTADGSPSAQRELPHTRAHRGVALRLPHMFECPDKLLPVLTMVTHPD